MGNRLTGSVRRDFTFLHPEVIDERCSVTADRLRLNNRDNPELDLVSVCVQSALLREGKLIVVLDFPYPAAVGGRWAGDWNRPAAHTSELQSGDLRNRALIRRTVDDFSYHVGLGWSPSARFYQWSDLDLSKKKLRIIREEEPPRSSTRLSTLDAALETTVAKKHHTDARTLVQQVSGELDWIVMKSLDKDRRD